MIWRGSAVNFAAGEVSARVMVAVSVLLLVVLSCAAYYAMLRQNASLETIVGQRAASMRAASLLRQRS
mgnify:CR=1 FL=1